MFTTDKIGHGYLPTYLDLAARIGPYGRVCEVGVANGESLDMWQHLFPHGFIVGVDCNGQARWPEGTVRIVASQEDPGLAEQLLGVGGFYDLVIDDASHNNDLTRATWCHLWDVVRPGGWYVIEDWTHAGGLIREFGKELTDCFDEAAPLVDDVETITYQPGLIILRKKAG